MLKLLLFINIFFNCHGNQFSVYIFITASNQYVTLCRRFIVSSRSFLCWEPRSQQAKAT